MTADPEPKDRRALEELQLDKLRRLLQTVLPRNPFWIRKFTATPFQPQEMRSLQDLGRIPFITKAELAEDQATHPPYGTNLTWSLERYCRLHQTSGSQGRPLRWLDDREGWDWILDCWRRIYEAVGLKASDRLCFTFSFGPFLGFWAAFEGGLRLGNLCLPAGGMSTSARLRFLLENEATMIFCTPTYALRMAEAAEAEKLDLAKSPVRALVLAGEPGASIPATRGRIESAWGARVFDHYGMTEVGSLGIECEAQPGGFHLLETECIMEVIDPVTGEALPPGREGELVLTNLGRTGSPMLRYRSGDRVMIDPAPCPCGRITRRVRGGVLGRADDMLIVRGTNVYPSAVESILRRYPEVADFRIVIPAAGAVTELRLEVETAPGPVPPRLAETLIEAIRAQLLFRPELVLVAPGTLPRAEMKSQRVVRV